MNRRDDKTRCYKIMGRYLASLAGFALRVLRGGLAADVGDLIRYFDLAKHRAPAL